MLFTNLDPGTYRVVFPVPDGFDNRSPLNAGGDPALDSDADPDDGGRTVVVTLPPNGFNDELDAGFYATPATIKGTAWLDEDSDGQQDPGEPSLPGVLVKLTNEDTGEMETTETDGDGNYEFDGLDPNDDYRVEVTRPDGVEDFTDPNVAPDAVDSDFDSRGDTGFVVVDDLVPGGESVQDVGFIPVVTTTTTTPTTQPTCGQCVDPDSDTQVCTAILASDGCAIGQVCSDVIGETLEICKEIQAPNCCLTECHICNLPTVVFTFEECRKVFETDVPVDLVYDFVCDAAVADDDESYVVAAHATIECDGPIDGCDVGGAPDEIVTYNAYYEIVLGCDVDNVTLMKQNPTTLDNPIFGDRVQ